MSAKGHAALRPETRRIGSGGSRRVRASVLLVLLACVALVWIIVQPQAAHPREVAKQGRLYHQSAETTPSPLSRVPYGVPDATEPPDQPDSPEKDRISMTTRAAVVSTLADFIEEDAKLHKRELWDTRRRHAERHAIAPVRGCFVSLIRHSDEGIHRLHRLLINLRQRLPLMSSRYPFVAFHETQAASHSIAKTILMAEVDYREGHQRYGGSVLPFEQQAVGQDPPHVAPQDANQLTSKLIAQVGDDLSALKQLLKRFVFPDVMGTNKDRRLRDPSRRLWHPDSGDISGVELVPLPLEDFGNIPSHIRGGTWPYPQSSWWGVSYRHMCRFFGIRIFFTPFLVEHRFDYYMRLDTDSFLLGTPLSIVRGRGSNDTTSSMMAGEKHHVEETDYFVEMQDKDLRYAFCMMHPQTQGIFLTDLHETYDSFVQDLNQEKYSHDRVVERHQGRVGRSTSSPVFQPRSELPFPRRDMVHYWDNFEVVDLNMFRERRTWEAQQKYVDEVRREDARTLQSVAVEDRPPSWTAPDESGRFVGRIPNRWRSTDLDVAVTPSLNVSQLQMRLLERIEAGNISLLADETVPIIQSEVTELLQQALTVVRRRYDVGIRAHNERLRRIQSWFQAVETKGGFYYHRWGDAEIRTMTMSLFALPSEIAWAETLPYQHYFNFHCPSPTTPLDVDEESRGMLRRAAEACEAEARQGYGEGSKSRGSARMNPAELSHYNDAFSKLRHAQQLEEPNAWRSI